MISCTSTQRSSWALSVKVWWLKFPVVETSSEGSNKHIFSRWQEQNCKYAGIGEFSSQRPLPTNYIYMFSWGMLTRIQFSIPRLTFKTMNRTKCSMFVLKDMTKNHCQGQHPLLQFVTRLWLLQCITLWVLTCFNERFDDMK